MKKTIITLALIMSINSVFAIVPSSSVIVQGDDFSFTDVSQSIVFYDNAGNYVTDETCNITDCSLYTLNWFGYPSSLPPLGDFTVVSYDDTSYGAMGTLDEIRLDPLYMGETNISIIANTNNSNGVSDMIGNATSSFMATTGFTPAQSITSVGGMFIMPFIGGGIMLFTSLFSWIIALVVLSAFVYFAYRAFFMYGKNGRNKKIKHK